MTFRTLGLTAGILCCAALAFAQQPLRLQITGGRVTLHAQNVPVRTILSEWSRLGGAKIVNAERIAGQPVTLDLENVPERQALDILLRGVSGYVLAARVPGAGGASMYDRIMILPTSAAPRNPPPVATLGFNAPTAALRPGPRVGPESDDTDDSGNDGVPLARPVSVPRPVGAPIGPPVIPPAPIGPDSDQQPATPPATVSTPSNPFGLPPGSSLRPGVISPAPQPQQGQTQQRNGPN